jgi:hypothetical protein
MAEIDLTLLQRLAEQNLEEVRAVRNEMAQMRQEMADVRRHTLLTSDFARRSDRRMSELKDDLELIVRSEVGGRLANAETRFENEHARLERRIEALEEAMLTRTP